MTTDYASSVVIAAFSFLSFSLFSFILSFFLIFSSLNDPLAGPQMYELVAGSRSDRKIWMERITEAGDDFKRKHPHYQMELSQRMAQAGVDEEGGAPGQISEDELPFEVRLGTTRSTSAMVVCPSITFVAPLCANRCMPSPSATRRIASISVCSSMSALILGESVSNS